jgi:hypothetical protein
MDLEFGDRSVVDGGMAGLRAGGDRGHRQAQGFNLVSTLGKDDPEAKRPERAPEPSHDARPAGNDLSPFQGEPLLGWFPGLKP